MRNESEADEMGLCGLRRNGLIITLKQIKLLATVAPNAKPERLGTTLKRLQETLHALAADAKLLLRRALSADGTASLEGSTEPSPVERLAAAVLSLDTRGLTPP